jgi:hypothetical protein
MAQANGDCATQSLNFEKIRKIGRIRSNCARVNWRESIIIHDAKRRAEVGCGCRVLTSAPVLAI